MMPEVKRALGGLTMFVIVVLSSPASAMSTAQEVDPRLGVARRAVLDGRVQEALELLTALTAERPESGEIALWMGHALRRSGDRPAAARQYLQAVRLDPANAGAFIALGDVQSDAGDLPAALDYYERAIVAAPEFPLGYRKAAGIAVQLVLHRDAIEHLRRYLELRPGDIVAMSLLGMEQYLDEDIDAAVTTLERVVELDPDHVGGHFALGMALADRPDDYERALAHLETATAGDPGNAMAQYLIGRVRASRGELEPALEALRASLAIDSKQPDAHYQIALVYARSGNRDAARTHQTRFQELSRARDEEEELQRQVGLLKEAAGAAMVSGDLAEARAAAAELAQLAPDDADVLIVQTRMALTSGDPNAALHTIDRALQLYPEHWEVQYLRGLLLHRVGRPEEGRAFLERSLTLNSMYGPGYAALGNLLMALAQPTAALSAYQSAVTLEPTTAAHYLNLATAYGAVGEGELEARALATHRRMLSEQ